jgi:dynein heavy chain
VGLEKIYNTENEVKGLQKILIELEPQIKKNAAETAEKEKIVSVENEEADKVRAVCEVETRSAVEKQQSAKKIEDKCNERLKEAVPKLKKAQKAVESIDAGEITKVKKMTSPPEAVKTVLKVIGIMFGEKPLRKPKADGVGMEEDWWTPCLKMLSKGNFLIDILNFSEKKEEMLTENIINKMTPYYEDKSLDAD